MKRITGLGVATLALLLAGGCAVHTHRRFGPPPPPPPPRGMMMGHPHGGPHGAMVWVPGYQRWEGRHWRSVEGRWMKPPRPGMAWVPGYRERRGGGWIWIDGYWR